MSEEKTILIVDDDPVVLRTMKEGLGAHFKVFGANSGTNAMKILEKKPVDLVLLDFEMPDKTGAEVLADIRSNAAYASVKIAYLSGKDGIDTTGADAAEPLLKSLPLEEIVSRVNALLG